MLFAKINQKTDTDRRYKHVIKKKSHYSNYQACDFREITQQHLGQIILLMNTAETELMFLYLEVS